MALYHFVKTELVEKEHLLQAIRDLNLPYRLSTVDKHVEVRASDGRWVKVEIKISTRYPGYDIGLRRSGHVYEVIADWYGIHNMSRQQFMQRLTRRYAYHAARAKIKEQGFSVHTEEVQKGGRVHLVLHK